MTRLNKHRLDYSIRFQPFLGTPEEQVLTYLRNHKLNSAQALAMQAIRPYWLPLMVLEDNAIAFSQKQQFGRDAVRELLLHIDYICSSLGLERLANDKNLVQGSKDNGVLIDNKFNSYQPPHKLISMELDIELGNGEWGSLGTFCD